MSDGRSSSDQNLSRRPIDLQRNAAGIWQVGTDHDGPIVAAIPTKTRLYFVKSKAIYAVQLADQIDPERENPSIPNTQQKEFSIGSDNPDVTRILLTADVLFKKTALGESFDVERGIELSLDLLRDVVVLREMTERLNTELSNATTSHVGALGGPRHSLQLPSLENVEARCDAFAQKAAHVVQGLEDLTRFFYPSITSKWIDSLKRLVRQNYGESSQFSKFLERASPCLMFVKDDFRNLIEHSKPEKHVKVHNFRLMPSGDLTPPTIEIVRPDHHAETAPLHKFMTSLTDDLVDICEAFLVHLCAVNVKGLGPFGALGVIKVTPNPQRNQYAHFSYAYYDGQKWAPLGVS